MCDKDWTEAEIDRLGVAGVQEFIAESWKWIKATNGCLEEYRIKLGMRFDNLRKLYSQKSTDVRRLAGPGTFEQEIVKRGYKPSSVREWIADYKAVKGGGTTAAQKRKSRRLLQATATGHPLTEFASLLPFEAAQAAYREAAKILHPDHGGTTEQMQKLNEAWESAKKIYKAKLAAAA